MDENWIKNLEARAPKAPLINRYRPTPEVPQRVDMNDEHARAIRQALLAMERERSQAIIIGLVVLLVASFTANVIQAMLYAEALQRLK